MYSNLPKSEPQNDISYVKQLTIFNYFHKAIYDKKNVTLEAPYLSFCIIKQQSLKEKVLQLVLIMAGKICYFLAVSLAHPYMKQLFFLEWP
jgi:hypothetical protein